MTYQTRTKSTCLTAAMLLLAACEQKPAPNTAQVLVPGSVFHGVHGLRFDAKGDLYAASVVGQAIYKVDIAKGTAVVAVGPRAGMADDLAFGPDGTMVWTSIEDGILHIQSPGGPVRNLYDNIKGVNAISYSRDGKHLYFSLVFYGDALFEADPLGGKPPRKIAEDLGGLNGFEVGDDGMIYGPLYFKGEVVQVNPASGAVKVIADEFKTPAAVKLDFHGNAYVADSGSMQIIRIDLAKKTKTVVAQLIGAPDNLALQPGAEAGKGKLYTSLAATNAIVEVDIATGATRDVISSKTLTSPAGLALLNEQANDILYVGDSFGDVKRIDGETGKIEQRKSDVFQPVHVAADLDQLVEVSEVSGTVELLDRNSGKQLAQWKDLKSPGEAVLRGDAAIAIAERGAGQLLLLKEGGRKVVAAGLEDPAGMAAATGNSVYVTERATGRLLRFDLGSGERHEIAKGLQAPEAVATSPDGRIFVMEMGAKRITRIDPISGAKFTVAEKLPVGWSDGPSLYRGMAASDHALYFVSDIENAIYKIVLQ